MKKNELERLIHATFSQQYKLFHRPDTHTYCEQCYCHTCRDSRLIAGSIIKAGYVRLADVRVDIDKVEKILDDKRNDPKFSGTNADLAHAIATGDVLRVKEQYMKKQLCENKLNEIVFDIKEINRILVSLQEYNPTVGVGNHLKNRDFNYMYIAEELNSNKHKIIKFVGEENE